MFGPRPKNKPSTGKRRPQSIGRAYCRNNPDDPSCYYPGNDDSFVDGAGRNVDSGCRGGVRGAQGNPPQCDFRKITSKGDAPNINQLGLNRLSKIRYHFGRARIEYANSQALLKKYSPYRLTAQGWPDVPTVTPQQCANPTTQLINQLNAGIVVDGGEVWVNQRGRRRLKCGKWGFPNLRWPQGMAARNRYFQMGLSYSYKAVDHLIQAHNLIVPEGRNPEFLAALSSDEVATLRRTIELYAQTNDPSIQQWRSVLSLLRTRKEGDVDVVELLTFMGEGGISPLELRQQIQEAAAAAALDI